MPIADQDHPQHDGEVGENGRGPLARAVRFAGEDVKQGIAWSPLLEDIVNVGVFVVDIGHARPMPGYQVPVWHPGLTLAWGFSPERVRSNVRLGRRGVMTFDMRKTNIATQANVRPLAERLGSSSGRRTMAESTSIRKRKKPPTTKSHK